MKIKSLMTSFFYAAAIALAGCGGGGGETVTTAPPAPPPTTLLSGLASKGPIAGGTVTAFPVSFGAKDATAPLGQAQTDAAGAFAIDIGSYQGPVVMEVTGGTFIDEATGATVPLTTPMRTVFSNATVANKAVAVTPLTELAFRKAEGLGPLTAATINAANTDIGTTFGLKDIVSTLPDAAAGAAGTKYADACGCFSQLAANYKTAGETTGAAVARLLTQLGNEQATAGGFSVNSIAMINGAITSYEGGTTTMTPIPTPTGGVLKIGTAVAPGVAAAATNVIAGVDLTVDLPAGVTVNADAVTGETAAGVVTISGAAAVGTRNLAAARFIAAAAAGAPAQLHIVMANSLGFPLGECLTIQFGLAANTIFPAAVAFTVSGVAVKALDGTALTGITAAPLSVAAGTGATGG